eukprot:scaffold1397_cov34-Cylindrotheca_fusiformis.AAC.2
MKRVYYYYLYYYSSVSFHISNSNSCAARPIFDIRQATAAATATAATATTAREAVEEAKTNVELPPVWDCFSVFYCSCTVTTFGKQQFPFTRRRMKMRIQ